MENHILQIIDDLANKVMIIENFTESKKVYQKAIDTHYDYLKQGFEHLELRSCPVYFRFFDREDEPIHKLELRHFMTNLMFWEPLVRMGLFEHINESYIVDCNKLSSKLIKNYIDNMIILPFRIQVGNAKLNRVIHDMIFNLGRISTDFNMILGLSINIETFIDVANKNEEFNQIIRTKLDENMQPNEIEATLNSLMERQIEILKTEDNFLRPILLSGTGIKDKQLSEFSINGGLKPDLDGNTIPVPINSNFIVGGLNSVTNYYIDSLGGRKAIIMNRTVMGKSGHFSRMMMLLTTGVLLNKSGVHDCGTIHPIEMEVKTAEHLHRLKGRNYRLPTTRNYTILTGKEKHLIGKIILLRSPVTCATKEICKTCYGELYYTNRDIESIGGYAGAKITEPLSQSILSSKHLLTTQSEKVEFNDEFEDFFSINANEIVLNNDLEDKIANNHSLLIIKENIVKLDDVDESEFNKYVYIFHVKNKKTGEIIEMREKSEKELYLAPEFKELMKSQKGKDKAFHEVDLNQLGTDERIFVVEISNNELTKPLYNIMYLLDNLGKREQAGIFTIDQTAQRMLDLLIESKIDSDSVHGEILIRPLIRAKEDILDIPNFRKYDAMDNVQILTVKSALERHPSVLVSLSFQDLGRQLINPLTFRKVESSFIDPFFKERP